MGNINTESYWESRFSSGDWNQAGCRQTKEYAKANVKALPINSEFTGSFLDFGCAMGDAIPIYSHAFPKAQLHGIDISKFAIESCEKNYGSIATFSVGDHSAVIYSDIIVTSHVMEHLSDDKKIVEILLKKCRKLFVIVPYMESPLYHEHVNFYDEFYYDELHVDNYKIFNVSYDTSISLLEIIKNIMRLKISFKNKFFKNMIMYEFNGYI